MTALGLRGGVAAPEDDVEGGAHAMRELRTSCEEGNTILRTSSRVVRERIWRRAPVRHAMWDAVGDATESDVAGRVDSLDYTHIIGSLVKRLPLYWGETSIISMAEC